MIGSLFFESVVVQSRLLADGDDYIVKHSFEIALDEPTPEWQDYSRLRDMLLPELFSGELRVKDVMSNIAAAQP